MKLEVKRSAALLALLVLAVASIQGLAALFLSLLAHELAHIAIARITGVKVKVLGMGMLGMYLRREQSKSPIKEVLIAAAGPLCSLTIWYLFIGQNVWVENINLGVGIVNLIPTSGSDGRRILHNLKLVPAYIQRNWFGVLVQE